MKKIILLALCAALASGIAGCGKKTETGNTTEPTAAATETVSGKKTAKIGDIEIDDATYNFFYNMMLSYYPDEMQAIDATNMQVESTYIATVIGKKAGLDPKESETMKKQIKESYGSDEEYQKFLTDNGLDENFINKYSESYGYYMAIVDEVSKNADYTAEAEQYFKDNYLRAKHVLVMTEGLDEAAKAEKKKLAEDILKRAESGEDFDALVSEYSEDPGSKSESDGYVFPEGQMVDEFYQGTKNIEIGAYNLVESSYGYHVIKRLALDETKELYDKFYAQSNVESTMQAKAVDDYIKEKKDEYGIKIEYKE